ncbi:uncharacterized protein LOC131876226 [Cryptomeria japonica]|uniref:uncharacterized protein LOC131876226 n=1 Tax=Cryptomeria japonica TaxID=3369 RepID=UPI0027DA097B|nr:uncharacterized protein LOC131876226 [Cryptomeria japonica]
MVGSSGGGEIRLDGGGEGSWRWGRRAGGPSGQRLVGLEHSSRSAGAEGAGGGCRGLPAGNPEGGQRVELQWCIGGGWVAGWRSGGGPMAERWSAGKQARQRQSQVVAGRSGQWSTGETKATAGELAADRRPRVGGQSVGGRKVPEAQEPK